jgi:formylglycine-generating enzyme required for sulfatase activity
MLVFLLALPVTGCAGPENLEEKQKPGEVVKEKPSETVEASSETLTNSIGMKFKLIPAGSFLMGSPESEKDREKDEILHKVTLTKPYYLGVYEVTQEQYEKVMGSNPSEFKGAKRPVEMVSWNDAQEFCRKLSQLEKNMTYRLPSEAEWEYAARAGTKTLYYWGDSFDARYAWCGDSVRETQEVGTLRPNAWGLYDMSGNVFEWCEDRCGTYSAGDQVDPLDASIVRYRVVRGGDWDGVPRICRSAFRGKNASVDCLNSIGFRVVAVPKAGR